MAVERHTSARARVDKQGRLVIPAEIRHELEIEPGEPITIWVEDGMLRAMTLKQAIKNAQAIAREHLGDRTDIVDDFLRERRKVSGD